MMIARMVVFAALLTLAAIAHGAYAADGINGLGKDGIFGNIADNGVGFFKVTIGPGPPAGGACTGGQLDFSQDCNLIWAGH